MKAARPARCVSVLLPALGRLRGGLAQAPQLARRLGRGDVLPRAAAGRDAQLLRHFRVLPARLAVAPITRSLDADDAHLGAWLRCDPAHVRPDMNTARLLAFGEGLALSAAEAEALLVPLRPLFGDFQAPISAPHPGRWYVQVAEPRSLPAMAAPEEVVGDDLLAHLPAGTEGRRWRQLWNEAQVILHQHPLNAQRSAAGKPAVNSLWFWGGGVLPDSVASMAQRVLSMDPLVHGLAARAKVPLAADGEVWQAGTLVDLLAVRDIAEIDRELLPEAETALRRGDLDAVLLDFADGHCLRLEARQRWRFWRRPALDWAP